MMLRLLQLNDRGFTQVLNVLDLKKLEELKNALFVSQLSNVNEQQPGTLPAQGQALYEEVIQPLVDKILGPDAALNEWQASTIEPPYPRDQLPHVDGQGYIGRGGTWDKVPGFRLLVAVPLSD